MMQVIREAIAGMPYRQRQVAQVMIDRFPEEPELNEIREEIRRATGELLTMVAVKRSRQEARRKIREELVRKGFLERRHDEQPQ